MSRRNVAPWIIQWNIATCTMKLHFMVQHALWNSISWGNVAPRWQPVNGATLHNIFYTVIIKLLAIEGHFLKFYVRCLRKTNMSAITSTFFGTLIMFCLTMTMQFGLDRLFNYIPKTSLIIPTEFQRQLI